MKLEAPDLMEFFSGRVDEAARLRQVPLSEQAQHYLADLLVREGRRQDDPTDPGTLAELHLQAANAPRSEAMRIYRTMGDRALYTSGYFPESLSRKVVGVDYYADMGGAAYGQVQSLASSARAFPWSRLFGELAERFRGCMVLIADIADWSRAQACKDIVQLYELWLHSNSPHAARRLGELGVLASGPPALDS